MKFTSGYQGKYQILLLVLLVCILPGFNNVLHAQNDTTYFVVVNNKYISVDKKEAKYYRLPLLKEGDKYKLEDYYIDGNLYLSTYVNSPDSMLFDGYTTNYYQNGKKMEYGNYCKGVKIGQWKLKYQDTDRVWAAITYYYRDTEYVLRSFYKSGKLKRIEYKLSSYGNKDSLIYFGQCFNENGDSIKFTPFYILPKPSYDVNLYLAYNIHYPSYAAEYGIEGRISTQFVVMPDGTIADVKAFGPCNPLLAKEATRVVGSMPAWNPGIQDDVPVKVYYSLPVTFKLN